MRTGAGGIASIFYSQPPGPGVTSEIVASAITSSGSTQLSFLATTGSDQLFADPNPISIRLNPNSSGTTPFTITNTGTTARTFTVSTQGVSQGQYGFSDSDQINGPVFVWNDISTTGTHLDNFTDKDEGSASFEINFEFPFYGGTFHAIDRDGTIQFYYKDMIGTVDQAIVGIQNQDGTQGLTVVCDKPYLHNNLAVQIANPGPWLTTGPSTVALVPGQSATLNAIFNSSYLPGGTSRETLI